MVWYKASWIPALQEALDEIVPARPKPDGTIGDTAHQKQSSGHNPDDTPGVTAERQDADTRPEVRGLDVKTFPELMAIIVAILTGSDKNRLIYIIYRGYIWRKANGWRREIYTGENQHFDHAHFSGDPESDQDASPWNSVKGLAIVADSIVVTKTHDRVVALQTGESYNGEAAPALYSALDRIEQGVAQVASGLSGVGGLTADDRAAIQALTDAVNALNSRLSTP